MQTNIQSTLRKWFKPLQRNSSVIIFSILGFLVLGGVIYSYFHFFKHLPISTNNNYWGDFGSFVGGLSGALLSFITVILLAFTLKKQIYSNRISRFESSFFELIQMNRSLFEKLNRLDYIPKEFKHSTNENVYKIIIEHSSNITEDDGYFESISKVINNKFDRNYSRVRRVQIAKAVKAGLKNRVQKDQSEILSELQSIKLDITETKQLISEFYDQLYFGHESKLGHYFRSLYHCIKFIKDSDLDFDHKRKFADLIQAHLSDSELHVLMYNGIGIYGNEKLLPLIEEFQLLENIKNQGPFFEYHLSLFYPNNYKSWVAKPKPEDKSIVNISEIREYLFKEDKIDTT